MERKSLIFILGRNISPDQLDDIASGIKLDASSELLSLCDSSPTSTEHNKTPSRQIQCSDAGGPGGDIKVALRYAIDRDFKKVFVIAGTGKLPAQQLAVLTPGLEENEAAFCVPSKSDRQRLQSGKPTAGLFAMKTDYLKTIPFERNQNSLVFLNELALQSRIRGGAQSVHVIASVRPWCPSYRTAGMVVGLHYTLCRAGFFYDRKFDLDAHDYPAKPSSYSSHSKIVSAVPSNSRVLDVGCGRGYLARELNDKGCTVDGIDLLAPNQVNPHFRHYHQINLNRELEPFAKIVREGSYDVILLADVIEHLFDPERFLEIIRENQSHKTPPTVIVCTGNVAFFVVRSMLALGQFNYAPRGILDRTHTRLFTRKSFAQIFRQAGFEILQKQWIPMPFTAVFSFKTLASWAERINQILARIRPGLFSYQMLFTVRPYPTTSQLLEASTSPEITATAKNFGQDSGKKSSNFYHLGESDESSSTPLSP